MFATVWHCSLCWARLIQFTYSHFMLLRSSIFWHTLVFQCSFKSRFPTEMLYAYLISAMPVYLCNLNDVGWVTDFVLVTTVKFAQNKRKLLLSYTSSKFMRTVHLFKALLWPHRSYFSPPLLYHCSLLLVGLAVMRFQHCKKLHTVVTDIWNSPVRTFDLKTHSGMLLQYLKSMPCTVNRV
jgi:hypothetical protein